MDPEDSYLIRMTMASLASPETARAAMAEIFGELSEDINALIGGHPIADLPFLVTALRLTLPTLEAQLNVPARRLADGMTEVLATISWRGKMDEKSEK